MKITAFQDTAAATLGGGAPGTVGYPLGGSGTTLPSGAAGRLLSLQSDGTTALWVDQWINVKDWGAIGDGVANDTTAIQAAITAAPGLGTVFFPTGTYKITATLAIPGNLRLLGAGGYPGAGVIISMATANTTAISTIDGSYLQVEGIRVYNAGASASGRGIYALGTVTIRDCDIRGFYDGVYIDGVVGNSYLSTLDNTWLTSSTRAGLYLAGKVNNIRIRTLRSGSNAYGIYATGGIEGATISDSDFESNTTTGILWDGTGSSQTADSLLITGGWFDANGAADISIGPTTLVQGVVVQQCFFEVNAAVGSYALDVKYCDRLIVTGCHFKATSGAGSIRCDATNTTNVVLVNILAADPVTTPASTRIIDPATNVAPSSVGGSNSAGTSKYFANADHVHLGLTSTTLAALTDVSLASLADADRLRYSTADSKWHNTALIWTPLTTLEPTSGNYLPLTDASGNQLMAEA